MARIEMNGGITASPYPAGVGDQLSITYQGLLDQSGADKVFLHAGYSQGDRWTDITDYEMTRTNEGWQVSFKVQRAGKLSFCFKDRADNWDNNNGQNWIYQIDPGRFKYS